MDIDMEEQGVPEVKRVYSREEITEAAWLWLRENYPHDSSADSASKWWERFGMMVDFINDHFPTNAKGMAPGLAAPDSESTKPDDR